MVISIKKLKSWVGYVSMNNLAYGKFEKTVQSTSEIPFLQWAAVKENATIFPYILSNPNLTNGFMKELIELEIYRRINVRKKLSSGEDPTDKFIWGKYANEAITAKEIADLINSSQYQYTTTKINLLFSPIFGTVEHIKHITKDVIIKWARNYIERSAEFEGLKISDDVVWYLIDNLEVHDLGVVASLTDDFEMLKSIMDATFSESIPRWRSYNTVALGKLLSHPKTTCSLREDIIKKYGNQNWEILFADISWKTSPETINHLTKIYLDVGKADALHYILDRGATMEALICCGILSDDESLKTKAQQELIDYLGLNSWREAAVHFLSDEQYYPTIDFNNLPMEWITNMLHPVAEDAKEKLTR